MRPQLMFVDGSPADQIRELADYMQVGDEVKALLENEENEAALKKLVDSSIYLNSVPEKEFTPAYNLLIYVVTQSKEPQKFLPTICGNLSKPIPSSPAHAFTLASNALTTIFNLVDETNVLRAHVFRHILKFVRSQGQWDVFKPTLKNLEQWMKDWDADEEQERAIYTELAETANEANDSEESYRLLVKALHTWEDEEQDPTEENAQQLSLRALRMTISSPNRYDFQDLRSLRTIQALVDSHPVYSQLLDIFAEQDLEDFNDFLEEHEGWLEAQKLDHDRLQRKMRLLTFASLAASTPNREIPYANIAKALVIPSEAVEMWTIDVIRAGLVEGRLSQQKQMFLVHRTTYRVFGEKQWRELGTRVDQFKNAVDKLVVILRRQQAEVASQKDREQQEIERKLANAGISEGGRQDRRRGGPAQKQRADDDD